MTFPKLHALRLLTLFSLVAAGLQGAAPEVLLENDQVRVVRAVDEPHVATEMHKHDRNRVMIYLQAGSEVITEADGKKQDLQWKASEVRWSPATGMHSGLITSGAPVTMIEVEIKKDGDPRKKVSDTLDPLKVDPQDYRLEFENSQVRVARVEIAPKRSVPLHEHVLNRVVVYLTDQNSSMTTPDGKTDTAHHKAGDVSWGGSARHTELNLNDKPLKVVVVELKD
jgi:hypothetical protein